MVVYCFYSFSLTYEIYIGYFTPESNDIALYFALWFPIWFFRMFLTLNFNGDKLFFASTASKALTQNYFIKIYFSREFEIVKSTFLSKIFLIDVLMSFIFLLYFDVRLVLSNFESLRICFFTELSISKIWLEKLDSLSLKS